MQDNEKKEDISSTPVWFNTDEFKVFLDAVLQAVGAISSTDADAAQLEASLKEMGRRYNHFIVQVTEFALKNLKNENLSEEDLEKKVLDYIRLLEQRSLLEFPKLMQFFFTYREKIRYME